MFSKLRAHSPCGANVLVSRPNQLTPVRRTSRPAPSTSLALVARSGPLAAGDGAGAGAAGAAAPTACDAPGAPARRAATTAAEETAPAESATIRTWLRNCLRLRVRERDMS